MIKQSQNTSVSVGLGGSWRALENENKRLAACLANATHEAARAEEYRQHAERAREHACKAEAVAFEERARAEIERAEWRSEASALQKSLSESSDANTETSTKLTLSSDTCNALHTELATCQQALRKESDQAAALRAKIASAESHAAQECTALAEMTASHECVSAELHVAESRLSKRAMHVDLLLRDKERLWSQVARLRKRSDAECHSFDNGGGQESVGRTSTSRSRSASEAPQSTPSKPSPKLGRRSSGQDLQSPVKGGNHDSLPSAQVQLTPEKRSLRKGISSAPTDGNLDVIELQKKAWHLQKALDRERSAHEQTREEMLQRTQQRKCEACDH
mmetsp:Transcript_62359/g.97029  ORF Transcript_62359/g.97029 Transcript_62359/m.97029 type:complete len:335 (+) Transcript_62359:68-1072(+)